LTETWARVQNSSGESKKRKSQREEQKGQKNTLTHSLTVKKLKLSSVKVICHHKQVTQSAKFTSPVTYKWGTHSMISRRAPQNTQICGTSLQKKSKHQLYPKCFKGTLNCSCKQMMLQSVMCRIRTIFKCSVCHVFYSIHINMGWVIKSQFQSSIWQTSAVRKKETLQSGRPPTPHLLGANDFNNQ
jgi:hypothetical protein